MISNLDARDVEDAADALSAAIHARQMGDHMAADVVLQQVPSAALAFVAVQFLFATIEGFTEGAGGDPIAFADILGKYGQRRRQ